MKNFLLSLMMISTVVLGLGGAVYAQAPSNSSAQAACQGLPGGCAGQTASANNIQDNVKFVIKLLSWIVGTASIIMMILGGFRFVTSGGDSGRVSSARNTILYAIIGLAVVAAAQIIVNFVLGSATK
jgi:magnesium-transporting ATPase (P-type)